MPRSSTVTWSAAGASGSGRAGISVPGCCAARPLHMTSAAPSTVRHCCRKRIGGPHDRKAARPKQERRALVRLYAVEEQGECGEALTPVLRPEAEQDPAALALPHLE